MSFQTIFLILLSVSCVFSDPTDEIKKLFEKALSSRPNAIVGVGFININTGTVYSDILLGKKASVPNGKTPLFEIGSITKTLTSTSLAFAAEKNILGLHDPVQSYLRDVTIPKTPTDQDISFWHLATQTSGLPTIPTNLIINEKTALDPYANYTVEDLKVFLLNWTKTEVTNATSLSYLYSNTGFGLLGYSLSVVLKTSYDKMVQETVCIPLGMKNTFTEDPSPTSSYYFVQGYNEMGRKTPHWHFQDSTAGAGAIRSTVEDMLLYAKGYLQPPTDLFAKVANLSLTPMFQEAENSSIGLGWELLSAKGRIVAWHNGGTGGFRTMLVVDREKGVASLVLFNYETEEDLVERLGFTVALNIAPKY